MYKKYKPLHILLNVSHIWIVLDNKMPTLILFFVSAEHYLKHSYVSLLYNNQNILNFNLFWNLENRKVTFFFHLSFDSYLRHKGRW